MNLPDTLAIVLHLARQIPADYVGVSEAGGVTVIVTNEITAHRWRAAFDARPEIKDADVRLLAPIGVAS